MLPNTVSLYPGGMGASLCVTGTTVNSLASGLNRRPTCTDITTAPFTAEDVEPLVAMVTACPINELSTRVFQQHHTMGTCWHDSLIMILFHINPLKETVQEHARFLLEFLLRDDTYGQGDLVYGGQKAIKVKYGTETYNNVENINPSQKVSAISEAFRERYPQLPRSFWDLYVLALQRFLLLNYMFLKPGLLTQGIETAPKSLLTRRKSIAESNFTSLHSYFKQSALKATGAGLWCYNIGALVPTFDGFISLYTNNRYKLYKFTEQNLVDIQAYYIWIAMTHVISLFKCGNQWFVFDNDEGVAPFSEEDSVKLSTIQILSMRAGDDPKNSMKFVYTFQLTDGSNVSASTSKLTNSANKIGTGHYGGINAAASFVVAQTKPVVAKSIRNTAAEEKKESLGPGLVPTYASSGGRRNYKKRKQTRKVCSKKQKKCQSLKKYC